MIRIHNARKRLPRFEFDRGVLRKVAAESLGQVGHFIKVARTFAVHPAIELPAPESGLSCVFGILLQCLAIEGEEIG